MAISWIYNYGSEWKSDKDKIEREFIIVGAEKDDIEVTASNGMLYLFFGGNSYTGRLEHRWQLPDRVKPENITSKYEAGVLTITIQKPEDFEKKIPIEGL